MVNIIARDTDLTILAALANATQDFGTGTMDLTTILGARAILGNNQVPTQEVDNMFGIISPAAEAYMLQIPGVSPAPTMWTSSRSLAPPPSSTAVGRASTGSSRRS